MSYIIEGVYLGSIDDALKVEKLKTHQISHVLTIDSKPLPLEIQSDFKYKYIHALDLEETDILTHLEECLKFIDEGRRESGVFVHCFAGQSRSSSLVIAHIMVRLEMGFEDAMKLVRCQKGDIQPNEGFQQQLLLFEEMDNKIDRTHKSYKIFKLQNLSINMQSAQAQTDTLKEALSADPSSSPAGTVGGKAYKCRKCRRLLFKNDGVLPHNEGQGEASFRFKHYRYSPKSSSAESLTPCTRSLFIEPIQWMADSILEMQGKLACPKCSAKLGSFSWVGERCPCGTWVAPAFHVQTGKVDEIRPRVMPPPAPARTLPVTDHAPAGSQDEKCFQVLDKNDLAVTEATNLNCDLNRLKLED